MPKMQNRVQETTTTGGTGTITLAGAVTGYITFAAGFTTGDVLFYTLDNGIGEWEIGIGTLVTTGTLSRTTVIASSNSGALVNFSSGTKRVFCSAPTRSLVPDQDSKSGYVLTTDGTNPSWTQTLNSVNIGNTTAGTGAFTTLSASSTVSGIGFSNYLASPPAIGGSSPAAGAFTTLSSSSTTTVGTNLVFSGTGNRITGDFSNATFANRVVFQSSTTNGATAISAIPNGTAVQSQFDCFNNSDINNSSRGVLRLTGSEFTLSSQQTGTGTFLPLTFFTGGSERVRIDTSGNVGLGVTPSAWASGWPALQIGTGAAVWSTSDGRVSITSNLYVGAGPAARYISNGFGSSYSQIAGVHTWSFAQNNTSGAGASASPTAYMTLTAAGVLQLGSAISLDPTTANALVVNASGVVSLSQGQIKFPATQVASSDVNTLDDYEEGAWSPTISGFTFVGANNSTYHYVKIGKLVTVNILLTAATSVAIASGAVVSLPFTQERVASGVCISPNTGFNCIVTVFGSNAVFPGGAAASASFTLSFSYIATA